MKTTFTYKVGESIIADVKAGMTMSEALKHNWVSEGELRRWFRYAEANPTSDSAWFRYLLLESAGVVLHTPRCAVQLSAMVRGV